MAPSSSSQLEVENELPPAYETHSPSNTPATLPIFRAEHIDFRSYCDHDFSPSISQDKCVIKFSSDVLCSRPESLEAFLQKQISLPPRPVIRLKLWTRQDVNPIELRIDMLGYVSSAEQDWSYFEPVAPSLISPHTKGTFIDVDGVLEHGSEGRIWDPLLKIVHDFCATSSPTKS